MKTKLLRKLRKRFYLEQRNNKYRVCDIKQYSGSIFRYSEWTTKELAIIERRNWILFEASKYCKAKKIL